MPSPRMAVDVAGRGPMADHPRPAAASPAGLEPPTTIDPLAVLPGNNVPGSDGSDTVDGFFPRHLLSVAPRPLEEITLTWPPGVQPLGRQAAHFTVFIDEAGRVRQMVADGPTLTPQLEEAAREVFRAAAFAPGEWQGQAVKSVIRIEVVFEAAAFTPGVMAPTAPTVVSSQTL